MPRAYSIGVEQPVVGSEGNLSQGGSYLLERVAMDLHDACENGNLELIRNNLTKRTDGKNKSGRKWSVHSKDETGRTALHAACFGAQLDVVRLLMGQPVTVDTSEDACLIDWGNGQTVHARVQEEGQKLEPDACVNREQLKAGSTVYRDMYGNTPLITSCYVGSKGDNDFEIAKILIEAGDHVNATKPADNMSALAWAAFHGDLKVVRLLLSRNNGGSRANPVVLTKPDNQFPIDLAGMRAMMMRKEGLKDDPTNSRRTRKEEGSELGNPEACCRELLKDGIAHIGIEIESARRDAVINVSEGDVREYRKRLLYWASFLGETKCCQALLEEGDPSERDREGHIIIYFFPAKDLNRGGASATKTLDAFYIGGGVSIGPAPSTGAKIHSLEASDNKNDAFDWLGTGMTLVEVEGDVVTGLPFDHIVTMFQTLISSLQSSDKSNAGSTLENRGIHVKFAVSETRKEGEADAGPVGRQPRDDALHFQLDPLDQVEPFPGRSMYETPLHVACTYGHADIVKIMVKCMKARNEDLGMWDQLSSEAWFNFYHDTPLHCAVLGSQMDFAKQDSTLQQRSSQLHAYADCVEILLTSGKIHHLGHVNFLGWREWDLINTPKNRNMDLIEHAFRDNSESYRQVIAAEKTAEGKPAHYDFVLVFDPQNVEEALLLYDSFTTISEETLNVTLMCTYPQVEEKDPKKKNPYYSESSFTWPGVRGNGCLARTFGKCLSQQKERIYMQVGCSNDHLRTWAEHMNLRMKVRGSMEYRFFSKAEHENFEPFRSRHRQQIILDIMKRTFDKDRYLSQGVLKGFFATHTDRGRSLLSEHYFSDGKKGRRHSQRPGCQRCCIDWPPLRRMSVWMKEGPGLNFNSLTFVKVYLGQKYAMFFAWLEFHTTWMILMLSIPGIALQVVVYLMDSDATLVFFAIYVVLWFAVVTERWKRKRSELLTHWNVETGDVDDYTRPEFFGDIALPTQQSRITDGKPDKVYPNRKRICTKILGLPVLFLCIGIVITIFVSASILKVSETILAMENAADVQTIIGGIQAASITVMNACYSALAMKLTTLENHPTDPDFEFALAVKTFVFQFVNSYLSLFYYMIIGDLPRLKSQLINLLVVKQVTDLIKILLLPYLRVRFRLWRRGLHKGMLDIARNVPHSIPDALGAVAVQEAMLPPKSMVASYIQLIMQLGYCTMFAAVFPAAGVFAVINNVFVLRFRMKSFLWHTQRPTDTLNTNDIPGSDQGLVYLIMAIQEIMTMLCIISNCFIVFHIYGHYLEGYFALYTTFDRLLCVVIAENALLFLKMAYQNFITDTPNWVVEARKTSEAEEDRKLLRQYRITHRKNAVHKDDSSSRKKKERPQKTAEIKTKAGGNKQRIERQETSSDDHATSSVQHHLQILALQSKAEKRKKQALMFKQKAEKYKRMVKVGFAKMKDLEEKKVAMHEQKIQSMQKENKLLSEQILLMQIQLNKFSARGEEANKPPRKAAEECDVMISDESNSVQVIENMPSAETDHHARPKVKSEPAAKRHIPTDKRQHPVYVVTASGEVAAGEEEHEEEAQRKSRRARRKEKSLRKSRKVAPE